MKAQTRLGSLAEAAQNILVGYAISVGATYTIGPFFHIQPGVGEVLGFGGVMTAISIARSYALRRYNEWKRGKNAPPDFLPIVEEIAAERARQIGGEGYSLAHDDEHVERELARGAAAYCLAAVSWRDGVGAVEVKADAIPGTRVDAIRKAWPWGMGSFKPTTARRNLIKAAAMIVAEIGRLDRAAKRRG